MLDKNSSTTLHRARDLALIALSFLLLPLNTLILLLSSQILPRLKPSTQLKNRSAIRSNPGFHPKTILVTGVGMTKGLVLARLFYLAGHDVVGADFQPGGALPCGMVSKAIRKFYRLQAPSDDDVSSTGSSSYVDSVLDIVRREHVELWVSCSGVASAVEDGTAMQAVQAKTSCRAVQFNEETTRILHEKHSFIQRVEEFGLPVPETHEVTSRSQIEQILDNAYVVDDENENSKQQQQQKTKPRKRFILKPIGVDDTARADMTLLPSPTRAQTTEHISRLPPVTPTTPWIVQQFIPGLEFCTHALVVRGRVLAFVACPSAELLMHYEALDPKSTLSRSMLKFTQEFARKWSGDGFTGHLSFDFLVDFDDLASAAEENKEKEEGVTLYPIECNPRAHTAVVLFKDTVELVDTYLSVLDNDTNNNNNIVHDDEVITPHPPAANYYWLGHDLTTHLLLPLFQLILLRISLLEFIQHLDVLADHLLFWADGTWVAWDPAPMWWLYQVYWPMRLWDMCWRGKGWTRVNVSTGKMFEC